MHSLYDLFSIRTSGPCHREIVNLIKTISHGGLCYILCRKKVSLGNKCMQHDNLLQIICVRGPYSTTGYTRTYLRRLLQALKQSEALTSQYTHSCALVEAIKQSEEADRPLIISLTLFQTNVKPKHICPPKKKDKRLYQVLGLSDLLR